MSFSTTAGIPVSSKASGLREPATRQTWIGWTLDTIEDTVSVPPEKLERLVSLLGETTLKAKANTLRARELAQLAGLASHVAEVLVQGRARLTSSWRALGAAGVYLLWRNHSDEGPLIQAGQDLLSDLAWWSRALRMPPTRALLPVGGRFSDWGQQSSAFSDRDCLAREGKIRVIETDAAREGRWAFHATWSGQVVAGDWPSALSGSSINMKELWVTKEAIDHLAGQLRGWRVLLRVDNSTSVHYINVRFGASPHLTELAAEFELAERRAMCWCTAAHIRGQNNVIADLDSRAPSFPSAWAGDKFALATLRKPIFLAVERRLKWSFTLDLFADREGRTALAPRWRSPESTAFEADLSGETVWCHPPPSLLAAVFKWIDKIAPDISQVTHIALLVPADQKAPWFHRRVLAKYHPGQRWESGADLFRWVADATPVSTDWRWRKGARSPHPYLVLTRTLAPTVQPGPSSA